MLMIIAHHYVVNSGLTSLDSPMMSNPTSINSLYLWSFGMWGLIEWLMSLGINSRTLLLLMDGEVFQDSGRGDIYNLVASVLDENLFGLGLFGDRALLDGGYCHNIILEMLVNWGIIPMMAFFLIVFVKLLILFFRLNKFNKNRLVCYTLVLIGPLMASGSYLQDPELGIYCGLFYLMSRDNKLETVYKFK